MPNQTLATSMVKNEETGLMQIVLLINLLLNLTVRSEFQQVRIFLPSHLRRVNVRLPQTILQFVHGSARILHLFIYGVLEIAREIFNLLYLLVQITSQPHKSQNDIILDFFRLVGLCDARLVIRA